MTYLTLNFYGRLEYFEASPNSLDKPIDEPGAKLSEPDWKIAFEAAGLDFSQFNPAEQSRGPHTAYDVRAAWVGARPQQPDVSLHVEAAAYRGRLVYFYITEASRLAMLREQQINRFQPSLGNKVVSLGLTIIGFSIFLLAGWMARRNWKMNKGDRIGSFRLMGFVFVCSLASNLLSAHHIPTADEVSMCLHFVARSLLDACYVLLFYLALEPYVRKRWPNTLIGLQRLLTGAWLDPLVGKDILLGMTSGLVIHFIFTLLTFIGFKFGLPPKFQVNFDAMFSLRNTLGFVIGNISENVYLAAGLFFLIFMMSVLLRRDWLMVCVFLSLMLIIGAFASPNPAPIAIPASLVIGCIILVVARRFGLLALFVLIPCQSLNLVPLTTNLSAWYAGNAFFVAGIYLAVAIFAFRTSLGGQKVFTGKLLEE